ncbi:ATP-binding cassette domain-containing protein [Litorivicinus lipolyticus]|uniref:ATP-binding cassette domain-containing protein n=1 Tax=Litorivicinus lipolyticus TaxID=418701 RepID=UPI003B58BC71
MALITLRDVRLSFGGPLIFDGADFRLQPGEKVGIVGRNGEGKSTLFGLLKGLLKHDSGSVERQQGLRVAALIQEVPQGTAGSIAKVVADGLGDLGQCVNRYHDALDRVNHDLSDAAMNELADAQADMDAKDAWSVENRVERVLSRLRLDGETEFSALSGGMKRRVLLAQALVAEPDVLLLDEPTNHLDIDAVEWLETFLKDFAGTLLLITHDRAFLQAVAGRIVELDRGKFHSYDCNYQTFLERRAARLEVEAEHNAQFDKKLAQEEVWIRQGIKARRTRNEGRVRALQALRKERSARREQQGTVRLALDQGQKSGKQVVEAKGLRFGFPDRLLFDNVNLDVVRGDKIGILGPNGAGKSTLLRILLGQIEPQQGTVEMGTRIEVAYFDQMRGQLDESLSALDNVSGGSDTVTINGRPQHIMGYMQDFLFSPARARAPISALSGGERNRLLLAKLFTKPANLLVMDEPTNDLDAETLELLESLLVEYSGTLFLVSHDRTFINNVVTHCWAFEGGSVNEYIGGYDDWVRQRPDLSVPAPAKGDNKLVVAKATAAKKVVKLSFKEKQALESLPLQIEQAETAIAGLQTQLADPELYQQGADAIAALQAELATLESALMADYEAWEALEAKRDG